jgi:hypothetical protein
MDIVIGGAHDVMAESAPCAEATTTANPPAAVLYMPAFPGAGTATDIMPLFNVAGNGIERKRHCILPPTRILNCTFDLCGFAAIVGRTARPALCDDARGGLFTSDDSGAGPAEVSRVYHGRCLLCDGGSIGPEDSAVKGYLTER